MGIQFCIDLLVLILFIYYITIGLHFMGLSIYVKPEAKTEKTTGANEATVMTDTPTDEKEKQKKFELSFWKSLIPFFYWFKRETTI